MSFGLAVKAFWRVWRDPLVAGKVEKVLLAQEEDEAARKRRIQAEQIRLLSILQRDGRLVDFLQEDVAGYSDAQIGAAVRDIHRDCRSSLAKHLELAPIHDKEEDSTVEVPAGFDPQRIRLTGNVKGNPPYRGVLAHRGWQVKEVRLSALADGVDPAVLFPAEVEIS